jgi:hypothetical protein
MVSVVFGLFCSIGYLLCGLVVRVSGYRSKDPGPIPGATRFFSKVVGLERGPLSFVVQLRSYLEEKVTAPV